MFGLTDKNILWTYVPPEIDWIHNKNFYLIDLYCLCISVKLFKSKFKYKSIKLYTNQEIIEFFKDTEYFDEFIDISNCYDIIKKQDTGFSHKNVMFKIFVAAEQTEPFIHIDHDFFINNDKIFELVDKDIIFSVNANNVFTIQLEFENIGLYGFGGAGGNIVNGVAINPKNGGPIFNIDNIEYGEKKINYYIYKDADSVFMCGPGGGQAWLITDATNEDNRSVVIPGSIIEYLIDTDLTQINP